MIAPASSARLAELATQEDEYAKQCREAAENDRDVMDPEPLLEAAASHRDIAAALRALIAARELPTLFNAAAKRCDDALEAAYRSPQVVSPVWGMELQARAKAYREASAHVAAILGPGDPT